MKKSLGSSFLMPLATIFVVAVTIAAAIHYSNNSKSIVSATNSSSSANTQFAHINNAVVVKNSKPLDKTQYQNYAMAEPFADHVPFESSPTAWIQMMTNMMNTMQMTQMMHQMASMPMIMMNPMGFNPHNGINTQIADPHTMQPMSPKEYKKWYEKQLESKNMSNK